MGDGLSYLPLAVLSAAGAALSSWHWQRCYRREWIYYRGTYFRRGDPFNYWFNMGTLAACAAVLASLTAWFLRLAFGSATRVGL